METYPSKLLKDTEKTIKAQYRKQLLEGWSKTEDNRYFLQYQRNLLYKLVREVRFQSCPEIRIVKQLEAEALAEFLQDYELTL